MISSKIALSPTEFAGFLGPFHVSFVGFSSPGDALATNYHFWFFP